MSVTVYRGKHPHRIESVFKGGDGLFRCRLNDGSLYILYPSRNASRLPRPGQEITDCDLAAYSYEGQSTKRRAVARSLHDVIPEVRAALKKAKGAHRPVALTPALPREIQRALRRFAQARKVRS
jgi:hypothetical protein